MNKLSVNHSVQELLKGLQHLIEELKNNPENTSLLELDLMKEKIRHIYDQLGDIEIKKPEENKEEEVIIPEIENIQEPQEESKLFHVPELDIEDNEKEEIEFETEVSTETLESVQPISSAKQTLDLFEEALDNSESNDIKSVSEKIAEEKTVESIGEVIQSKKILNLKLAIGINEKFFFLNELFDGKMNEYNKTIETLDQKDTFKDAIEHLDSLKEDKNWDEESEAYLQLKGFLEKKFN